MVNVLEELELDRLAEAIGRLQSVEDDPAASPREMLVEVADGTSEDPCQVALPFVPLIGLEVAARDPPAAAVDRMEIIADGSREIPGVVEVRRCRQRKLVEVPVEETRCVFGVILRIAASGQVAEDPSPPFADQARAGPIGGRPVSCRRPSTPPSRSTCPAGVLLPVPDPAPPTRTHGEQSTFVSHEISRGPSPHPEGTRTATILVRSLRARQGLLSRLSHSR